MSHPTVKAAALALAGAASLAALGSSTAQAAQTATVNYRCKFPLIGTQPLKLDITLDIPNSWEAGKPTTPFAITAKATAGGTTSQGLGLIEGLHTLGGVIEAQKPGKGTAARARVELPDGTGVDVRVPIEVTPYTVVPPIPNPLVLNASGTTPSLTLDVEGTAKITLTELILNLYGHYDDGTPVEGLVTPPTDIDRQPYSELDWDTGTFNVPCKLDPATQNLQLATFELTKPTVTDPQPPWHGDPFCELAGGGLACQPVAPPQLPPSSDYVASDAGPFSVNLRWRAADGNADRQPVKYRIDYEGAPAGGVTVPVTAGRVFYSQQITGLDPNSDYTFGITGIDAAGAESRSIEQELFTGYFEGGPPTAVTGLAGTSTETSIALSWDASTDSDGTVAKYDVYAGATKVASTAGFTTSTTITGLQPNTDYTYTVKATDDDGAESGASAPVTVKTKPDTTAPTNPAVSSTITSSSATLSWTASADNIGVVGYDIYRDSSASPIISTTGLTTTITGLASGTSYTFKVVAKDAAGNRSSGGTINVTIPGTIHPVARLNYQLSGSTQLKTLTKGTLPLTGAISAELLLSSGSITADLTLADTSGRLVAAGFLPVTAKVGFVPSGKTTGSLIDGVLKTSSKVRIKVKEIKLFGAIPLAGGNSCQTKNLSDINLQSTQAEFLPLSGGPLAGTYKISDLNGCGPLGGLVSPLTAGGGNTISLNLVPLGAPTS